jgi:hypothetical protein
MAGPILPHRAAPELRSEPWPIGPPRNWSRAASVAEHFLRLFGFEVYLPRVRHYWIRYGRRVEVLRPYFAAYCFTRSEVD